MNEISLPYHLLIPILISILILVCIVVNRKILFGQGKWRWFWISATVFCGIYILIVGEAAYLDISYKLALQKFDLNNDGFFTMDEITTEQKEAMRMVITDTGRNFSIITGLIFSGIIALFVFAGGKVMEYINSK